MTVLKGATAAAIYGSRAANGAIIITTKSGQRNQGIGIEYSGSLYCTAAFELSGICNRYMDRERAGLKPTTAANAAGTGQFGWGAKMDGSSQFPFLMVRCSPYSPHPNNLFDYYRTGQAWNNTLHFQVVVTKQVSGHHFQTRMPKVLTLTIHTKRILQI